MRPDDLYSCRSSSLCCSPGGRRTPQARSCGCIPGRQPWERGGDLQERGHRRRLGRLAGHHRPAVGSGPADQGNNSPPPPLRGSRRQHGRRHGLSPDQDTPGRQALLSPDRPRPRPVRGYPRGHLARLPRQERLRRLGRGLVGARSPPVRHRERRRGLCEEPGREGEETRPRDLLDRHPSPGAGPRRRALRQDAPVHRRRAGRGLRAVAQGRQRAAAHQSLLRSRRGGEADAGEGLQGSHPVGAPRPLPRQAPGSDRRRPRLRRLAGPLLEPLLRVSAAAEVDRRLPDSGCPRCQLGTPRRALRPGVRRLPEVWRDVRSRMPSGRAGNGRHRVGR